MANRLFINALPTSVATSIRHLDGHQVTRVVYLVLITHE